MKTVMIIMLSLISINAMAGECSYPKKVQKKKPTCQARIVEKKVIVEKVVVKTVVVTKTFIKRKMNLVQVLGGVGPNGIDVSRNGSTIEAEQKYGAVGGLGYSRRLGEDSDMLLGVQGFTNKSGMLSLGIEF